MSESHEKVCPKCGGVMEVGVLASSDDGYNMRLRWLPGPVKKGFWGGLTVKTPEPERDVTHYACRECGYIECYVER